MIPRAMLERRVVNRYPLGLLVAAVLGCADHSAEVAAQDDADTESGTVEEPDASLGDALEIVPGYYRTLNDGIVPLEDGGALPLRIAPQGGHYAFVAVRVKNVLIPEIEMTVRFYDALTKELLVDETRNGALVPSADDPEWLEPADRARGSIVHVPVCPVETPPGLYQRLLEIEFRVVDASPTKRSGAAWIRVTPDCIVGTAYELSYCQCECALPYDPGKCFD